MNGIVRKKGPLEVFKFAVYLAIPISLTGWVIFKKDTFQRNVIDKKQYVKYPPLEESHSFEDVDQKLSERRRKR